MPAHFGLDDPLGVARAFHLEELGMARLAELTPVVLAVCDEDDVAAGIVHRLEGEVVAFVCTALRRLDLTGADADVVLGGRILRSVPPRVVAAIARGVHEVALDTRIVVSPSEPIVGAALLGLDAVGADGSARARARAELDLATDSE